MIVEKLKFYVDSGWKLFPCNANNKKPITVSGFNDASGDMKQIEEWCRLYSGCAWGVPTSAEAGVFEYDKRHDADRKLWRQFVEPYLASIPRTWKSISGGGSPHWWFKWKPGTRNAEVQGSAFGRKAEGGYVIVPPSKINLDYHTDRYKWEVPFWETDIAVVPEWIERLFGKPQQGAKLQNNPWVVKADTLDLLTHPGSDKAKGEKRRDELCRLIGVHLARGDNPQTIEALVRAWACRCKPPLEQHEWKPHLEKLTAKERSKVIVGDVSGDKLEDGCRKVELKTSSSSCGFEEETEEKVNGVNLQLEANARHGLFGEMLEAIEPNTEADPTALLVGWLTLFGNIVGRNAWMRVGADTHYPSLFVGNVARSSDAKGVAWGVIRFPFAAIQTEWAKQCLCFGVSSGQGLIDRVRDERRLQTLNKKTGEVEEKAIPGAIDKRCLLRLTELSLCFKLQGSDKSTLGETLLAAWDGVPLETPNTSQGENYRKASEYSIGVWGDIQPHTLRKILAADRVEAVNGWMNRFLWLRTTEQRDLPDPPSVDALLSPCLDRLREAIAFAQQCGEVRRDEAATELWNAVYGELKRSGVPHTDRARPQVLRLALLFALADRSKFIRKEHLEAALSVWAYCRSSCEELFGHVEAEPDPLWLQILNMLPKDGSWVERWLLRDRVRSRFKRKHSSEELDAVLEKLKESGQVEVEVKATGGRSGERWKRKGYTIHPSTTEVNGCSEVDEEEEGSSDGQTSSSSGKKSHEEEGYRIEAETSSSSSARSGGLKDEAETSSSSSARSGGLKDEAETSSSSSSASAEKKSGEEKKGEQVMNNEKVEMVSTSNPDNPSERRL